MDSTADTVPTEALFRPAKKRKFARRRADPETEDAADADPALVASDQNDNATPTQPSYKNARRPRVMRKGGIGFSAKSQLGHGHGQQLALAPTAGDPEEDKIRAMNERFTGYTGQSDDVDRHMMEYIDSEMAKRYQPHAQVPNSDIAQPTSKEVTANLSFHGQQQQREPASLGKLHEIDLGQEATLRNIARTEAATRKLAGDEDFPSGGADIVSGATRSAPGGKSRRARQQRTDADIERDRLVEEVLRESKLDVYDEYEDDSRPDDPQAADDRIAEQFRRDFMDAMQSRRRLRATKPVAKDEGPKGPKLGGSRSARAAMRETQTGKK